VENPESLGKIVTEEEICILQYEPVSERQFLHGESHSPKEGEVQNQRVTRALIFCFHT